MNRAKIKNIIRKGTIGACITTLCMGGSVFLGELVGRICERTTSPKIRSQLELEEVMKVEREKLNIPESVLIRGIYDPQENKGPEYTGFPGAGEKHRAYCWKVQKDFYKIVLIGKLHPSVSTVKHELYHIKDGHCEERDGSKVMNRLRYWFIEEPKAHFYQYIHLNK